MTLETGEIVDYGCDWLTATTVDKRNTFFNFASEIPLTSERKDAQWLGYQGFQQDGLFYGERKDGAIVRLSSETARLYWEKFYDIATHTTRIDFQVTIQFDRDLEDLAKLEKVKATLHRDNAAHRYNINLHDGCGDGDTLYLGSRSSEQSARLYDKMRESGSPEYRNCWRYEVEYKDEKAQGMGGYVRRSPNQSRAIIEAVAGFFNQKGVICPFDDEATLPKLPSVLKDLSVDRSLTWLDTQVAPTVRRLIKLGHGPRAFSALGIDRESLKVLLSLLNS